jgi:rhodanese-related sulfurtransferase
VKKDSIKSLSSNSITHVPELLPQQAYEWIQEKHPFIIDIRSNIAYQASHISNSINIPEESFEHMVDRNKPFCKDSQLLIVCPTGERSKKYAMYLHERGYQAFNLRGGIMSWRDEGFSMDSLF